MLQNNLEEKIHCYMDTMGIFFRFIKIYKKNNMILFIHISTKEKVEQPKSLPVKMLSY